MKNALLGSDRNPAGESCEGVLVGDCSQRDRRPKVTLKVITFTPELRTLLNKTAKKVGRTQGDHAAEVLSAAARKTLVGTPDDTPPDDPLPVLPAGMLARQKALDVKLDALVDQLKRLTEMQRLGLWGRISTTMRR